MPVEAAGNAENTRWAATAAATWATIAVAVTGATNGPALRQDAAVVPERRQAHRVGVARQRAAPVQDDVPGPVERDRVLPAQGPHGVPGRQRTGRGAPAGAGD